jgi:asparagine synthase (glutamine-hydrolysing)
MSAVFGIFQRRGPALVREQLDAGLCALAVYGPEGQARWADTVVGLGYQWTTRTAESARESLPWHDPAANLAITADARLDDREGLAARLDVSPVELALAPDSQLILRAYQKWGHDCPAYLLGDFAFAIWDVGAKTLFCARDHMGVRPLYYHLSPARFVFATDIVGLLAVPGVSSGLDEPYVASHLLYKFYVHPERTFYDAARKLPPGHTMAIGPDTTRLARYWRPERARDVRFRAEADYVDAFREIYARAVRDRLRAVHPIGVHLSGGLDSSSVAVMAARELGRPGTRTTSGIHVEHHAGR